MTSSFNPNYKYGDDVELDTGEFDAPAPAAAAPQTPNNRYQHSKRSAGEWRGEWSSQARHQFFDADNFQFNGSGSGGGGGGSNGLEADGTGSTSFPLLPRSYGVRRKKKSNKPKAGAAAASAATTAAGTNAAAGARSKAVAAAAAAGNHSGSDNATSGGSGASDGGGGSDYDSGYDSGGEAATTANQNLSSILNDPVAIALEIEEPLYIPPHPALNPALIDEKNIRALFRQYDIPWKQFADNHPPEEDDDPAEIVAAAAAAKRSNGTASASAQATAHAKNRNRARSPPSKSNSTASVSTSVRSTASASVSISETAKHSRNQSATAAPGGAASRSRSPSSTSSTSSRSTSRTAPPPPQPALPRSSTGRLVFDYGGHGRARMTKAQRRAAERLAEQQLAECIRAVPPMFFEKDFSIRELSFFKPDASGGSGAGTSLGVDPKQRDLQDRLSSYLDQIELNLQTQVSARSDALFSALLTIQDLYADVTRSLHVIKQIRARIFLLHKHFVYSSLTVIQRQRKQKNLAKLISLYELIGTVIKTQPTVKLLLSSRDFSAALELIHSTRKVLHNELKGVKCVHNIDLKLGEMLVLIERMMSSDFITLAIHGNNDQLEPAARELVFPRVIAEEDMDRIVHCVFNLYQMDKLSVIFARYREDLTQKIKHRVNTLATDILDRIAPLAPDRRRGGGAGGGGADAVEPISSVGATGVMLSAADREAAREASATAEFSARLAALSHPQFLSLCGSLFAGLMDIILRAAAVKDKVVSTIEKIEAKKRENATKASASAASALAATAATAAPAATASDRNTAKDMHEFLVSVIELLQSRVSKVLATRTAVHAGFELRQLTEVFAVTLQFIADCEVLFRSHPQPITFYGLRGTVLKQAKEYLERFHAKNRALLQSSLESEEWKRVDVPREYQDLVDNQFKRKPQKVVPAAAATAAGTAAAAVKRQTSTGTATASALTVGTAASTAAAAPASTVSPLSTGSNASLPTSQSLPSIADAKSAAAAGAAANGSAAAGVAPAHKYDVGEDDESNGGVGDQKRETVDVPDKLAKVIFVEVEGKSGKEYDKYPVVRSMLTVLKIVETYIDCTTQLHAISPDLLNRVVDILTVFNSLTCQLVLGAGACQIVGLKTITATHLALASQSIGLTISQIPVLRRIFATRIPTKQHILLESLTRVVNNCRAHQQEIFTKLVTIVSELLDDSCKEFVACGWAKIPPEPESKNQTKIEPCINLLVKQVSSLYRALTELLTVPQRDAIFTEIFHQFGAAITRYMSRLDVNRSAIVKRRVSDNVAFILQKLQLLRAADEKLINQLSVFVSNS